MLDAGHRCGRPHLARPRSDSPGSNNWPLARALDIQDGLVYIGGNFTRITGPTASRRTPARSPRVDLATGNVDRTFLPNFDGVVFDVDATTDRVYAAGNFMYVNDTWSIGIAVLDTRAASSSPGSSRGYARASPTPTAATSRPSSPIGDQVWQAAPSTTVRCIAPATTAWSAPG